MKNAKGRIATGLTILGLAGLAGLALSASRNRGAEVAAGEPTVRTKVIHRTIHVTKHAKPRHPRASGPGGGSRRSSAGSKPLATGSSSTGSTGSTGAATLTTSTSGAAGAGTESATEPLVTQSSGAAAPSAESSAPVTTATSGGGATGGGGGGGEVESEGHDD